MVGDRRFSMTSSNSTRLLLVFRCGGEYVFIDNESKTMVTVTLSVTAVNMFLREDLTPDNLARQAAEWALATPRAYGSVDLTVTEDLSEFCRYYFSNDKLARQAC
jgi:hypothetical protein